MGRYWYLYLVAALFFAVGIAQFVDGDVAAGFVGLALAGVLARFAARRASTVAPRDDVNDVHDVHDGPAPAPRPGGSPGPGTYRKTPGIRRVGLTRRQTPYPASGLTFTILDIETTGLDPRTEGIVEVGVVQMRGDGTVVDEFATLVNTPGSKREAALIHGITDADLEGAPAWADVWPELAALIEGTVLVAHNLDFEATFLTTQGRRIGAVLGDIPAMCTLETARRQLDGPAYSLKSLHKTVSGYWRDDEHTALGDARATRDLLLWLLTRAPSPLFLDGPPPANPVRSAVPPTCLTQSRPVPLENASVANLLRAFPASPRARLGDEQAIDRYIATLRESLGDGYLSRDEADWLIALGRRTGLTGPQLHAQHETAWRQAFAAESGIRAVDPALRARQRAAAIALGLSELADQLTSPTEPDEIRSPVCGVWLGRLRIGIHGNSPALVALRGRAEAHGVRVAKAITHTVEWLAADDLNGSASALNTARKYGIPVLTAEAANHALDAAITAAERTSRQRAKEQRKREEEHEQRRRAADAQWRPAWRAVEHVTDPGPRRMLESQH